MPRSALPVELQDVENHFPDDAAFGTKTLFGKLYYWYQKKTKTWFAFSYRCTESWAKWRKYPKVLLMVGSAYGGWRYENMFGESFAVNKHLDTGDGCYLSRVQYYKRWHLAIQWPLMISFHVYFREKDVPLPWEPLPDTDGKLFFAYWNHFDADLVYWMITSIFVGLGWK